MVAQRFSIYLVPLDPAMGSEIRKTRPCVVVSPDELNRYLRTVLIAPMTTTIRPYVSRVACRFAGRKGQIALDQIRCVDQSRLAKRLGQLDDATARSVITTLLRMFS